MTIGFIVLSKKLPTSAVIYRFKKQIYIFREKQIPTSAVICRLKKQISLFQPTSTAENYTDIIVKKYIHGGILPWLINY